MRRRLPAKWTEVRGREGDPGCCGRRRARVLKVGDMLKLRVVNLDLAPSAA